LPTWTHKQAEAELRSHTGRRQIPTTFVAVADGRPLGSASLLESDLDGWEHLTPWLASVFVAPEVRGLGLGRRLVNRAVRGGGARGALGVSIIYLFTAGQAGYYEKLGWEPWQLAELQGHEVVVMRRRTPA